MTGAFDDLPVFVPPFVRRPTAPPGLVGGLRLFARDILSIFPESAFTRRRLRFRALRREIYVPNTPDLVREAFLVRHEALQRKSPQMRRALEPLLGDGLFVSDGALWRERRAAVAPIVHARNLPRFFPVMRETAGEWREEWRRLAAAGEPVDVLSEMGKLTAEIIARALFGGELGREHTGEIIAAFAEYQRTVDQLDVRSLLRLPGWVPQPQPRKALAAARRIHDVIDRIIARMIAEKDDPALADTFVIRMLAARDGAGRPFSSEAVRNEAIVIFMAGHETTANTLGWALYLLSQADWARERLWAELDAELGDAPPELSDVSRLVYARAVIEETMRLYPPVPLLGREAIADAEVGGEKIAAGTQVTVAPWLLHRNGKLWERPDQFLPERFLPDRERPGKYAYVPFAIGPRICPGMTFGLVEAIVCLATLMRPFELSLAPGHVVAPECRMTLRPGARLPMLLRERAPAPVAA